MIRTAHGGLADERGMILESGASGLYSFMVPNSNEAIAATISIKAQWREGQRFSPLRAFILGNATAVRQL
jgi:hypothetical protein